MGRKLDTIMLGLPASPNIVDIHRHEVFRANQIVIKYTANGGTHED